MWIFTRSFFLFRKHSGSETESKSKVNNAVDDVHPLVSVTQIDPEEIPKDPENRFLNRIREEKNKENESKNKENETTSNDVKKENETETEEDKNNQRRRPRIRGYTRSGRVIKGRGALVRKIVQKIIQFYFTIFHHLFV